MSSPTTTTTTTATTSTTVHHHHTYWCHECDMSILLPPTATPTPTPTPTPTATPTQPPRCPHCHTDFLEHMDSFTPLGSSHPSSAAAAAIWGPPHSSTTFPPLTTDNPSAAAAALAAVNAYTSDDNFLLNSPYLHRLIQHLTTTSNGEGIFYDPAPPSRQLSSPASKRAVESLRMITIDNSFLEKDKTILCPICKDQFCENSEAKELPCKHIYHDDCITPWLEVNNTCPLCRFKLATEEDEMGVGLERGEAFVGAMSLEELVDDDDGADILGFRHALMRMGNGNGNEGRNERAEFVFSPTQIGEAGNGVAERANSAETVSSWPAWASEGDREVGVGDDENAART